MIHNTIQFFLDYGALGMFIHAFIDAIIFPIPAFFLQVSISLINPQAALWYALVGYIGCLLGTPIGYLIGKFLGEKFLYKILKQSWVDSATIMFNKNGEGAILIGSFTPIPFKVFTILSGALHFSFWRLILFAAIGRALKFFVVGSLFYIYGRNAKNLIDSYLTWIFLGIAVVLTLLWVIVKKMKARKQNIIQNQEEDMY